MNTVSPQQLPSSIFMRLLHSFATKFTHSEMASPISQEGISKMASAMLFRHRLRRAYFAPAKQLLRLVVITVLQWSTSMQAADVSLTFVPSPPETGTFFSLQLTNQPPTPFDPIPGTDVYSFGNGFIYDDTQIDYSELSSQMQASRIAMSADDPGAPGDGTGTNIYSFDISAYGHFTNDLWLEILSASNDVVSLAIHPPTGATNASYELGYVTNLNAPIPWVPLLRTAPGQTNIIVSNLPPAQGFFALGPTNAVRPVSGSCFAQNVLDPNDDDYCCGLWGPGWAPSNLLPNLLAQIGFAINFYGATYTNVYVNNNGNVTFTNFLGSFTPTNLANLSNIIIAPFWADVDTRLVGGTTYGTCVVNGHAAFAASWTNVGYYSARYDKTNSFQLVVVQRDDQAAGDFDMEFNYDRVQWETGDENGGTDGLGGDSAAVGFYSPTANSGIQFVGSLFAGNFIDANTTNGLIYNSFDSFVPGRYLFQFRGGVPNKTP
jgi:hypothetical protein